MAILKTSQGSNLLGAAAGFPPPGGGYEREMKYLSSP